MFAKTLFFAGARKCLLLMAVTGLALGVAAGAQAATTVKFGVPDWPGEQVKADIASQILDELGYQGKVSNVSWIIGLKGVATGELDVDMALWRPTQNSVINPMLDKGEVSILTVNVEDADYDLVVPDYVYEGGVHSIADLPKFADKFDHKIYGIEAGNDGNELMLDAIKNDQYGLKDFSLVESSEAAMLSQVGEFVKNKKWIVFLGWRPHWMNVIYKIKFLDDPEKLWGGGSTVSTAVRPDYEEKEPNIARFLKQMKIPSEVQSQWIYDYGYKEIPSKKVASDWIKDNLDTVGEWLDGVTSADGKTPAIEVITKAIGS